MRSRLPQAIEHDARRKAVGDLAGGGLEIADGDAGARAEKPVGLADVVAAARQQLLHLEALAHRQRALTRSERLELQQLLASRGFDVGDPDGMLGAKTRVAIRDFQARTGLIPDGFASTEVLNRLRGGQ